MQTKQMAHGQWGVECCGGVIDHRSPVYSSWLATLDNVCQGEGGRDGWMGECIVGKQRGHEQTIISSIT